MKRQIRRNVFETNSSSMHSLVVKKNSEYYSEEELRRHVWLDENGVWNIWDDEAIIFGRYPFNCLETFEAKVRYAIASLCGYREDAEETFKEIESIFVDVIDECNGIKLPKNGWAWDDEDGDEENNISYGGVDEDILTPFLKETSVSLREFLINKRYVVIVDGDEYCIWYSLKNSGLVNMDEIEKEY